MRSFVQVLGISIIAVNPTDRSFPARPDDELLLGQVKVVSVTQIL